MENTGLQPSIAESADRAEAPKNFVDSATQSEMPKYRSHKTVWALKIAGIDFDAKRAAEENRDTDGSAIITPGDAGYVPFRVEAEYLNKHKPQIGGYYVVYGDGYNSWSPAGAFEEGYTRI